MDIPGFAEISLWNVGIVSVIAFFIYIVIVDRKNRSVWSSLGVPEVKSVPFFGSVLDLKKKGFVEFDMACAKKYGRFYGSYWGKYLQLHVTDPELVKEIFVKRFSEFHFRMGADPSIKELQGQLNTAFGDQWRFQRTVLAPTFSSGKMRMMNEDIQKCCEQLVDSLRDMSKESGGKVNLRSVFGCYTLDVIARTAFGIDINSQKDPNSDFVKYAKMGIGIEDTFTLSSFIIGYFQTLFIIKYILMQSVLKSPVFEQFEFFKKVMLSLIKERKSDTKKRKDFLQLMLEVHDENKKDTRNWFELMSREAAKGSENTSKSGEESKIRAANSTYIVALTTQEVISNAFGFFLAGYHTTATTLVFLAYSLAINPECQDRCIEEIDRVLGNEKPDYDNILKLEYLNNCVNETLRLYGTGIRSNRFVLNDTELAGYKIPKYTTINVNIYAMHHDPELWPDPEMFDPDRFLPENVAKRHPYAFCAFGHGPRQCIGMRLAYMETKAAIATILQNFRFVPCDQTEVPVKLSKSTLLTEENDIILKLEPRN